MANAARIISVALILLLPGIGTAQEAAESQDNSTPVATEQKPGEQDGGLWSQFIDKEDGYLDLSEWLIENAYGFLPLLKKAGSSTAQRISTSNTIYYSLSTFIV